MYRGGWYEILLLVEALLVFNSFWERECYFFKVWFLVGRISVGEWFYVLDYVSNVVRFSGF